MTVFESLPAWGVWIEMTMFLIALSTVLRRSPHGECGLKYLDMLRLDIRPRRSPHGECGLKSGVQVSITSGLDVAPRMGSVD